MIPSPPLGTDAAAGLLAPGAATGAGPTGAVAERRFRFELAAHPGSPAQARRLTRSRLTGWSVCEDTCDTAALIVTELVTNAIVHTASNQVVCELLDGDDLVRISVRDEGCAPGEPHSSPQRPEEEHGRGLLLVEALCRAWGAQELGHGLVVWADLPRAAATADGPAADIAASTDVRRPADAPASMDAPTPAPADANPPAEAKAEADAEPPADAQAPAHEQGSRDDREVRGDLGWGARPKPAPARHPGHEDDPRAAREPHGHPHAQHTPPPHHAAHTPHASHTPQAAHGPHAAPHGTHAPQASHPPLTPHTPQGTRPHEAQGTGSVWL
ncbi:ATP-binding protein [Streptomyces sp. PsTaAH-124]|uniref:ATP-binding protein n=1 Tax=Streptomyces sp. PsTaAH-124 TaxID=1157638 RepID=UPI0003A5D65C